MAGQVGARVVSWILTRSKRTPERAVPPRAPLAAGSVPVALNTPAVPAFAAAIGGVTFVLLRLAFAAKGEVTRFIVAGSRYTNAKRAPAGLHVFRTGYDGQFYYRLALDPADLSRTAFGITLDSPFRLERIGYPVLSWLAAAGQRGLVPSSEIAVNLAALTVLAFLGGVLAKDSGRHAAWGLLVAGYWGFLFSIGRDLPEVVASCFLVAGLVALRRSRPVLAGFLLAGAVLTLETTLDVVVAVALVSIVQLIRCRRVRRHDAAWVIPAVAFVGWQLVGLAASGTLPMRADTADNLGLPAVNMIAAVAHYLGLLPSHASVIWLGEFFVLALVTVAAGWNVRRAGLPLWERVAWGVAVLVGLCAARDLWYGQVDLRAFEDVYLLSAIVLLGSRRRLWLIGTVVTIAWLVTFARRVVII